MLVDSDLKLFLKENVDRYNNTSFIENDPISIPHRFSSKEDIEIIGFLVATIAWGNRKSIINNGTKLVEIMNGCPYEFILNATEKDLNSIEFIHRTFNSVDLSFFLRFIQKLYREGSNLESAFGKGYGAKERIINFREKFLSISHLKRSEKHISNPANGSAAKRINMYLRWMVRNDKKGVDFGIWNSIQPKELMIPLDVHTGNVARKLGLITRSSNDWKALEELMIKLKAYDSIDPCKYDYALFGIGVNKVI